MPLFYATVAQKENRRQSMQKSDHYFVCGSYCDLARAPVNKLEVVGSNPARGSTICSAVPVRVAINLMESDFHSILRDSDSELVDETERTS